MVCVIPALLMYDHSKEKEHIRLFRCVGYIRRHYGFRRDDTGVWAWSAGSVVCSAGGYCITTLHLHRVLFRSDLPYLCARTRVLFPIIYYLCAQQTPADVIELWHWPCWTLNVTVWLVAAFLLQALCIVVADHCCGWSNRFRFGNYVWERKWCMPQGQLVGPFRQSTKHKLM